MFAGKSFRPWAIWIASIVIILFIATGLLLKKAEKQSHKQH